LFKVNGALPASAVGVNFDATLAGDGAIDGIATVNSGGTIAPGGSLGSLAVGGLNLAGSFAAEIDLNAPAADLLEANGAVTLTGGTLDLAVLNVPTTPYAAQTYLLLSNDGVDAVAGTFASVNGVPAGFNVSIDYAFAGVDVLGRVGTGNDIAITLIPEPATTAALLGLSSLAALRRRRR
jgi:fibronectin-binding autotransporter adhesin